MRRGRVCLSDRSPMSATTSETRALPRIPGPGSQANIPVLRQLVGRPRLDVPQSHQPHPAGDDDGLLTYWLRFLDRNSLLFFFIVLPDTFRKCQFYIIIKYTHDLI